MGFSMFLVDSELVNINKLEGRRKLNLGKIDKIFKASYINKVTS